jgi:ribosomal protein S18 acetylase RimI-like enzyme
VSIVIQAVDAAGVGSLSGQLVEVYSAAFGEPPYNEPPAAGERFADSLRVHSRRRGFAMRVAEDSGGEVVGFAYGYRAAPGQWWHDRVAGSLDPRAAARWLTGAFELVELAVRPDDQRRGLGGALHDALIDSAPDHSTAVLSTLDADTPARRLYRRRGWRPIGALPPTRIGRFVVMGLDLVGSPSP